VDHAGKLGHPAKAEEMRYGATSRKVFLRKIPSALQRSFAKVTMNREVDQPAKRPWVRRGDEE
jgi:hypothetical protein